jgi:hypothetical protein
MADHFNPYHRWLGIPPEEQPPHHYRLLGLVLFESDLEVIRDGAERQMAHVRRYALGQHTELSQRILNELAVAKACLTDPVKKAQYDAQLRATQEPAPANPPPQPVPPQPVPPQPVPPQPVPPQPVPPQPVEPPVFPGARTVAVSPVLPPPPQQQPLLDQRKSRWPLFAVGLALVVVVAVGASLVLLMQRPKHAPLQLEPLAPRTVVLGENLLVRLRLTDPDKWNGKVRYRLGWGSPAGAVIDPRSGEVNWKPDKAGKREITLHAVALADERQQSETVLAVEVQEPAAEASRPPRLAAIAPQTVLEGTQLRVHASLADPGTGGTVHFHLATNAPQGMTIDEVTGEIAWQPKTPGEYSVSVSAANAQAQTDQTVFQVQVKPDRKTLSLLPLNPRTIAAGQRSTIIITTSEPPSASRRFMLGADTPSWITIDATNGMINCSPPLEESLKSYTVMVRVTDGDLRDEKPLVINIQAQFVESSIEPRDYRITFPSGKSVNSEDFRDVLKRARGTAESLSKLCDSRSRSVIPIWFDASQSAVAGLCQVKGFTPNGPAVSFYPGKDPRSLYQRQVLRLQPTIGANEAGSVPSAPMPSSTTRFPKSRSSAPSVLPDFWDQVAVEVFLNYDASSSSASGRSKWTGWVANWDNTGAKRYIGHYSKGLRDGVCCLFKEDRLRLVLECSHGEVQAVHLINGGKLKTTFSDPKQGEANTEAHPLIEELSSLEAEARNLDSKFQEWVMKAARMSR